MLDFHCIIVVQYLICKNLLFYQAGSTALIINLGYIQDGPKKWAHRLMTIILSNLNRLKKIFTGRFLGKFAVKWILKIPPHLAYVATLPCETLNVSKISP